MRRSPALKCLMLASVVAAVGCSEPPPVVPVAVAPAAPVRPAAAQQQPPKTTPVASVTDNSQSAESQPPEANRPDRETDPDGGEIDHPFETPFGERVNIFDPPAEHEIPKDEAPKKESGSDGVRLRGFVNVGSSRVVLEIDGQLEALAAGETKQGVKVVAINPPQVTLMQHDYQWVVSLDGGN